jgi:hypothetical protein
MAVPETGVTDIAYADGAGNPQVVLAVSEYGDGWLLQTATMCTTAPRAYGP